MQIMLNIFYIISIECITLFKAIVINKILPYNEFAVRERLSIGDFCGKKLPALRLPKGAYRRPEPGRYAPFFKFLKKVLDKSF